MAKKADAPVPRQQEHDKRGSNGHNGIKRLTEHDRRGAAQQKIPDAAAAKGGGQPQQHNAKDIQSSLQGHGSAGNGKGHGAHRLQHGEKCFGKGIHGIPLMWVGSIGGHGLALIVLVLGHQHLTGLAALKGAYNALFLHLVHQSGGTGIAHLKPALEQ